MTAIYMICFVAMAVGLVLVLHITPEQITKDFAGMFNKKQSLRDKSLTVRGKKKSHKLAVELNKLRTALVETGKEKSFSVALAASFLLMIAGCVVGIVIDNPFLIPVLAVAFALIPFIYLKRALNIYENHAKEELETALSIITTSYIRSDNILTAVSENVGYLKPPVRNIFEGFVNEATMVSPDIRQAIRNLKEKISNSIFEEWCDTLIACQNDRTLKDTLMPVVTKLTDVRLVNNSLKTMLGEVRREYYMMVAMVLANIPLLYVLNKDWYDALMNTMFGKAVLGICGVVIIVTALLMAKYTKPIEYKR